jgi:ATP-binding cassette subfamily B protein
MFKLFVDSGLLFIFYLKRDRSSMIRAALSLFLLAVEVGGSVALPYMLKEVVESVSTHKVMPSAIIIACTAGLYFINSSIDYLQDIYFFPIINNAVRNITYRTLRHVHQMPFISYIELPVGEIISAIKRISQSARFFYRYCYLSLIPNVLKIVTTMMLLLKFKIIGPVIFCTFTALCIFLKPLISKYIGIKNEAWEITDRATVALNDSIIHAKEARTSLIYEMDYIDNLQLREANAWYRQNTYANSLYLIAASIATIAMVVVVCISTSFVLSGKMTIAEFVLLKAQLATVILPLKNLTNNVRYITDAFIDIGKITKILSLETSVQMLKWDDPIPAKSTKTIPAIDKVLILDNVCFAYPHTERPLIQNASLHIKYGQKVCLIGDSGCGKSTLMHLIINLLEPSSGFVSINGINVQDYHPEQLNRLIHIIPQDYTPFNNSIRYNLTYGCHHYMKDEYLWHVLSMVKLDNLVLHLPKQLDNLVGEMGIKLSLGESRRLAIARSLLIKPQLLIIDETTSFLDKDCEKLVMAGVFNLIPTVFAISHKQNIHAIFDRVLVMEYGGRIKEDTMQLAHS